MYRIAICDDDNHFLTMVCDQVREYCDSHGVSAVVKKYDDAVTMIEDIEAEKLFDAYILDIEMGKHSGLEIARMIEARSSIACIIFLTSYRDYAIEACGMNVFRYVLKEKMEQRFSEVLRELFQRLIWLEGIGNYVISKQRRFVKFSQRDIIYIYKYQKNVIFVLRGGKEEHERTTLAEVYKKLNSQELFFLDRGIIVNLFHVQKILDRHVIMTEGYRITTSQGSAGELKHFLNKYWGDFI